MREHVESLSCRHPPTRLWSWTSADGVLCVACCECGAVLRGATAAEDRETQPSQEER